MKMRILGSIFVHLFDHAQTPANFAPWETEMKSVQSVHLDLRCDNLDWHNLQAPMMLVLLPLDVSGKHTVLCYQCAITT